MVTIELVVGIGCWLPPEDRLDRRLQHGVRQEFRIGFKNRSVSRIDLTGGKTARRKIGNQKKSWQNEPEF